MLNIWKAIVSCRLVMVGALLLSGVLSTRALAVDIPLINPSFEGPSVTPPLGSIDPADYVRLTLDGWDKTGPEGNDPRAPIGIQDTGVFINLPFDITGNGDFVLPTNNHDGSQLAFMVVNTDAFSPIQEAITISQTTSEVFEVDMSYTFKIDIGSSFVTPLGILAPFSTTTVPEELELIIGYGGGAGDTINVVASQTVSALDLDFDYQSIYAPLKTFDVSTGILGESDAAIGQTLRVMVRVTDGQSGSFILDNATLSSVPEPGSAALLGGLWVMALRRRR